MKFVSRSLFLKSSSFSKIPSGQSSLSSSLKWQSTSSTSPLPRQDILPISKMPSLKSYPLIGSSLALMRHKDFDRERIYKVFLSFFRDYGKIFKLKFPGQPPLVFISKPEDIEHLFRATTNNPVRRFFFSLKHVRDNNPYFENNSGLLTENHEKWRRVRSRVQTPLLRPKNLLKYLPEMDQTSKDFLEIIASYQRKLGEMPEHFLNDLNKWALESVALVALNTRLGCLKSDLPEDSMQVQMINNADKMLKAMRVTELGLPLWKIFRTPSYKKLKDSHDAFLSFADENIRKAEKDLMVKKSSNKEAEMTLMETLLNTDGLTRKDVVTMILDMLFGGIDTTSHTVAFTLYLLAKTPDKQKKLQSEIDEVLGDGKETLSENHLARLSYLKYCVKEALRLYPVIFGTGRELEKDEVFSGFLVPKGYLVQTFNLAVTMDEENFKQAKDFIPERWERDSPFGPIHPYASLPFSHGPRMCIGRRIAEQEIYTFLARALHRFDVRYNYKDLEIVTKLVLTPSDPLRFQFVERR